MKITEITEGYTDETWATGAMDAARAAKGAIGRGVGAVAGAAGRQMGDIKNTAMAKLGSKKAAGAQQMQKVVGGVIANFNRYLGQSNSKPTVGALKQYLSAMGFQNVMVEISRADMLAKNKARVDAPAKQKAVTPDVKNAKGFQGATTGRKDTDVLTRNELFDIIGKHIQDALKNGTLPKELKKFLGQ